MSSEAARSSGVPSVRIELTVGRRIRDFGNEGYGPVVGTCRAKFQAAMKVKDVLSS